MKKFKLLKFFFSILIFIFLFTQSKAEVKIAFVEMDSIMKNSLVGKSLIKQLDKLDAANKNYFKELGKKIKIKKDDINKQKNILSVEEYNKKVIAVNKQFEKFQNEAKEKVNLLEVKRNKAMEKILSELNSVLSDYSKEKDLNFILKQKSVVLSRTENNITAEIIKLLDKKISNIKVN